MITVCLKQINDRFKILNNQKNSNALKDIKDYLSVFIILANYSQLKFKSFNFLIKS